MQKRPKPKMSKVELGIVTGAVGIKGDVKVKSFAEDPVRFKKIENVSLIKGKQETLKKIESCRINGGKVTVRFSDITDRDAAERLRGYTVYMDESELPELPEGSFYVRDLIGMNVVKDSGEELGVVKDVLTDRPQDIYVVEPRDESGNGKAGDLLIPAVDEFIKEIDMDNGVIKVHLIEGME